MRMIRHVALLLMLSPLAYANQSANGFCTTGNQKVTTSGILSTSTVQASYPACTVTVYNHGTVSLSTIYSDNNAAPTPLANPFTSTALGAWLFYGAQGRYDVVLSGSGFPSPFTISDVQLVDPLSSVNAVKYLNTFRYADQFPGANGGLQDDAAISDCAGAKCTVINEPQLSNGTAASYPANATIVDYRAQFMQQWWNIATRNTQTIGLNIEQGWNPSGNVTEYGFAQASEIFIVPGNASNFAGQYTGVYGSISDFGSGTMNMMYGGAFEAFNSGPATNVTLVVGASGTANNGGVSAGYAATNPTPYAVATNNGSALNLRGLDGTAKNITPNTVLNAAAIYAEGNINSGGGAITNNYGLQVADQTVGVNNWSAFFGAGKFEVADQAQFDNQLSVSGNVGIGTGAISSIGAYVAPSALTGTTQVGVLGAPVTNSAATLIGVGIEGRPATAAAAFTQASTVSVYGDNPTKGAGSTITTAYAFFAAPITAGTTNYGFYESGTQPNFFGGTVQTPTVNATTAYQMNSTPFIDTSIHISAGGGANVVYRCATAGATLPVGSLTTNAAACGTTTDTALRVL